MDTFALKEKPVIEVRNLGTDYDRINPDSWWTPCSVNLEVDSDYEAAIADIAK